MLYKLGKTKDKFDSIDPCPFSGLPLEKELEDLLAQNLLEVLFEGSQLMPIFQERSRQSEADIYALNQQADLVIFELKRAHADAGAVHQALRYCEKAGRCSYEKLEAMFQKYTNNNSANLREAHKTGFDLDNPLDRSAFNKQQHLYIVGSASNAELIRNVDYWKSKGISISFMPYRVYEISGESYFEFFSLPYDEHSNPGHAKGVIFDTNSTYDKEGIWYMCGGERVAAFGDIKGIVHSFNKGDFVFIYHKGCGIVAAGKVTGGVVDDPAHPHGAMYRKLKWLTQIPTKEMPIKFMPVWQIKKVTGRNFWWAKAMKAPFLNKKESEQLLVELKKVLS